MFDSWLRQLRRKLFGTLDRAVAAPAITCIRRRSPSLYRPRIEELEPRLAPANIGIYNVSTTNNQALAFTAGANGNSTITVTSPVSDELQIHVTNDTITLNQTASQDGNFTLSQNNTTLTINTPSPVGNFYLYLPNASNATDTLNFGMLSSDGVVNVYIGSGNGPGNVSANGTATTLPTTDTHDTVNLNSTTITGNLNVSAATINLQGSQYGAEYQGTVSIASNNSISISSGQWPSGFQVGDSIEVANVPNVWGTQALTITSITNNGTTLNTSVTGVTDSLGYGAGNNIPNVTVEVVGDVFASTVSLQAVNSLTVQSIGVPYEGALTVNSPPAKGQPYFGDYYLTGPDWGTYFYAPGQTVSFTDAKGNVDTGFTVAAVHGHNLYFTSASSTAWLNNSNNSLTTGSVSAGSVYCDTTPGYSTATYTPQIIASTQLNLTVTGEGSSISGAIDSIDLNASTNNGNITIQDVSASNTTPLELGAVNAGNAQIQLDAQGSIFPAASSTSPNLIAAAATLISTGPGGSIGGYFNQGPVYVPLRTLIGKLTASTNDGFVDVKNQSSAPLTIDSVVANQGGLAPTVVNGQVVYNSTPSSSTPTYASGSNDVRISSTGPIVVNSISATGNIQIDSSEYILEGNAQSPTIIAEKVYLDAQGTAEYQGQVTFSQGASGDTLTLPGAATWSQLGFAAGQTIVVSGASASANKGAFTIASIAGATLTLTKSYALTPETDPYVTVGDGMIGQASSPLSLSSVPLFDATTNNGAIYLEAGMDSTAQYVDAGVMNGMANGVSVTSQADSLTIENITANYSPTGATMAPGQVLLPGQDLLSSNDAFKLELQTDGNLVWYDVVTGNPLWDTNTVGMTVTEAIMQADGNLVLYNAFTPVWDSQTQGNPGAYLALQNDGNLVLYSASSAVLSGHGLPSNTAGSAGATPVAVVGGDVAVTANSGSLFEYSGGGTITLSTNTGPFALSGLVIGQTVSLTSPYNIGTASSPFKTAAASGLTVNATATSPSSAGIDIDNAAALTAIGVSTYDGSVTITSAGGTLSFNNNVLSETGNALVSIANTDADDGSAGDVIVSGTVYVSSISAGIATDGTPGTGQILTNPTGLINGDGGAVMFSAGSGIGVSGDALNITNLIVLFVTTNTGDIDVSGGNSPVSPLALDATTSAGNISVNWNGDIDLASETSSASGVVLDSISATQTVTLDATGAIADQYGSTVYARALALTAGAGIGTASSPLETAAPGTLTLTATAAAGLFLDSSAALAVDAATAGSGDLSISATGNVALQGSVSGDNVSLTATAGTLTATAGTLTATAGNLTLTAEQIGSSSDVIQTNATTINATASYGGIDLSNGNSNALTLTAAAVGPSSTGAAPNNVTIYSAGNIVLQQQTTSETQLATSLPIAIFTPGGTLTLFAGETLSADGTTPTSVNSSATITSASATATATSTLDAYGGVASASVGTSGSGYKTAPKVTFSGGGGSGTTATATINAQGQVTGITITSAGSGYTSAPTVTLSAPGDDIYTGSYDLNGTSVVTSSSPACLQSLVIVSNTVEVATSNQGGSSAIPALITLADLTSLAIQSQTNGTGTVAVAYGTETVATSNGTTTLTIVAGAITIDDLGQNGSAGTAIIPAGWSLVLDATNGSVVFLNLGDTIKTQGTGTITITAGTSTTDVAALGNLTTGGGNITISAGGNIALGTFSAGRTTGTLGTIAVTSSSGAILISSATTPTFTASSTTLNQAAQPVYSTQSAALAELNATEVIAAADAASAKAVAATYAAGAQAAAELALVNSLQAALTSMQGAVTTANQTYQADVHITNQENTVVNSDTNKVTNLNNQMTISTGESARQGLAAAIVGFVGASVSLAAWADVNVPILNVALGTVDAAINIVAAGISVGAAGWNLDAYNKLVELNAASLTLSNDSSALATDQSAQDVAQAQLQADMDTETALTAAYDIAEQAYTTSEQAYTNDATISARVQAQGGNAQAVAIAGVVFASPSQPLTATAIGSGPVNIQALSPLTVSANTTAAAAINLTAAADDPTTESDHLTVNSGVTVQSTGSSVTLFAGNNVIIQSGSTIEAASPIAITANGNDDPNGATVTVAGTLSAPSASIGVDAGATGNETFNITPSATTPISVNGGSDSGGVNTLNFNAEGLRVTISGNKITAGTLAPVTFTNFRDVNITNEAGGSLTLKGTNGVANTVSLIGTGQEAGTVTLNGVAFSFSGITSLGYQGGGAGDTIAVTPFANPNVAWNLGTSFSGGTGSSATLTYNASGPNVTVKATSKNAGSVVESGVATVPFTNVSQVTVVYQGVANVELLPNLTVTDAGGTYNGKAVAATVRVNGAATLDGITPTVTYYRGNLVSPVYVLSGAPGNAGTYTVVAAYPGDATYASATASTTFTIAAAAPQVSVNPVKLTYGNALANGQLSGTATFTANGTKVTVPGTYSYTSAAGTVLPASATAYTETVTFTPSSTNYATQTTLHVLVTVSTSATTTALTSSLNPSGLGQSVTFTAKVAAKAPGSGTPTGTVTFKNGTTTLAVVTLSGGVATFSTSSLALGSYSITAAYSSGTGNYIASTSTAVKQVVVAKVSTTAVTTSQTPSTPGQKVTFMATVTGSGGTPTGKATFMDGATVLGTVTLSAGTASLTTALLTEGTHHITVIYSGNATFGSSTSTVLTQTVT